MCYDMARLVIHTANVLIMTLGLVTFFTECFYQLLLHLHAVEALHFGYSAYSQRTLCWSQFD